MANKKGLDGYFMKYGISQMDLQIIENVCQVADVEADWLEEEILAPYQTKRNSGATMDAEATYKIIKNALKAL